MKLVRLNHSVSAAGMGEEQPLLSTGSGVGSTAVWLLEQPPLFKPLPLEPLPSSSIVTAGGRGGGDAQIFG